MTKFGAAENKMKRLMAKFAQGTPTEYPLFSQNQNVHPNLKFSPKSKNFAPNKNVLPNSEFCELSAMCKKALGAFTVRLDH